MSDLISRKALLEFIEENYNPSWYNPTTAYFKDIITNAPTVQREGWVSVPIEPTEEMIAVAFEHLIRCDVENVDGDDIRSAIRYAIQAAPTDKK